MTRTRFGASTFIWVSPFSNRTLDLIDKVAEIGFDFIELCIEDPATIDVDRISSRLRQAGLSPLVCGAFGPERDVSSRDPSIRRNGVAYIKRCIDIAEALGSSIVAGPMYSATGKTAMAEPQERRQQWAWATENLREAADHAAASGVRLAIEPLNRFETDLVNTVEQGIDLVTRIGRANVGLLLDTFHMNIEEQSVPDAIRRAGPHVFHFHACANDRGVPGRDHLPWMDIRAALDHVGYRGPWVIEAFNSDIWEIARAVSLWRPLAENQDAIAIDGLAFLKRVAAADWKPRNESVSSPGRMADE
jgi:D-psicose/D-tagatose/L-ribulose 3-epimerase